MDYDTCTSLPAMFFANLAEIGDKPFLWQKSGGAWQPMSGTEAKNQAAALAAGLHPSESARETAWPWCRKAGPNG